MPNRPLELMISEEDKEEEDYKSGVKRVKKACEGRRRIRGHNGHFCQFKSSFADSSSHLTSAKSANQ